MIFWTGRNRNLLWLFRIRDSIWRICAFCIALLSFRRKTRCPPYGDPDSALMWKKGNIYPWRRAFDRAMPEYFPTQTCARIMPKLVAPAQNCRKCLLQRARDMKAFAKLRFSRKTNFGIFGARSECMSVCLVTPEKFYWLGFILKRNIFGAQTHRKRNVLIS